VIFIDGLHTFEQTLRDFSTPPSAWRRAGPLSSTTCGPARRWRRCPTGARRRGAPSRRGLGSRLDGRRLRVLLFIDSFIQGFSFSTVAETGSQTVVWRTPRGSVRRRDVQAIAAFAYEDLAPRRRSTTSSPTPNPAAGGPPVRRRRAWRRPGRVVRARPPRPLRPA
jgi:hypothetical protein